MDSKYLLRYHSPTPGYHLQWFPTVFCHPISTGARQQHQGERSCAGDMRTTCRKEQVPGIYSFMCLCTEFCKSTCIQDYQHQSCSLPAGALTGEFKIILACLIFPALPASVWSDSRAGFRIVLFSVEEAGLGFRIVLFCYGRGRIFWFHLSERPKFHSPTSCLLCLL